MKCKCKFSLVDDSKMLTFSFCHLMKFQIPDEEKNIGPNDRLIHVYHFTKEAGQNQVVVHITLKLLKKLYEGPGGFENFVNHYFFCSKYKILGNPSFW